MSTNPLLTSCRCCAYYQPEGRRGGTCSQLGVPVKGCWQACSLAAHPFEPCWDVERKIARLETTLALECSVPSLAQTAPLGSEPLEYEDLVSNGHHSLAAS